MTRTETIIGVDDKDTGLRGDVRQITERLAGMERRMYLAIGAGYVLLFIAQKLWK